MKYTVLPILLILSWISGFSQSLQPGSTPAKQQILYLSFHVVKTAAHPEGEWTLTNTTIVAGTLKVPVKPDTRQANANKVAVEVRNQNGEVVSQTYINNPLEHEYEYITEGGNEGRTTVSKTEADISVRLPWLAGNTMKDVKISSPTNTAEIILQNTTHLAR